MLEIVLLYTSLKWKKAIFTGDNKVHGFEKDGRLNDFWNLRLHRKKGKCLFSFRVWPNIYVMKPITKSLLVDLKISVENVAWEEQKFQSRIEKKLWQNI